MLPQVLLAVYQAGLAMPHFSREVAMSLMVLATGVYCRPRSSTTLLLLMWEAAASFPSGSAAASGMAAFKVSVMNLADMELGWLMMYLSQSYPAQHSRAGQGTGTNILSQQQPSAG